MPPSISDMPALQGRTLLDELNHRIKNELASLINLVSFKAIWTDNVDTKEELSNVVDLLHHHVEVHSILTMPDRDGLADAGEQLRKLGLAMSRSASTIRLWCVTCAGLARRSRAISGAPSSPANPSWRPSRGVLRVSIELMALSLLLSLSLAVPAGLLAAYRAGQSIDKLLSALAALLPSAPSFMLGLVLMFFLALTLKWLPAVGYVPLSEGILGNLRSFAIPVLTLALVEWPVFMRFRGSPPA